MQLDEIISKLIAKFGYKSYLEIGTDWGNTFTRIHCDKKVGVEPNLAIVDYGEKIDKGHTVLIKQKSDDFFISNKDTYDLILIDGHHEYKQATRDVLNALMILNKDGTVMLHDTLPKNEIEALHTDRFWEYQKQTGYKGGWTGDVYKTVDFLRHYFRNLDVFTLNIEYGLTVIRPYLYFSNKDMEYELFETQKHTILNLKEPEYINTLRWKDVH